MANNQKKQGNTKQAPKLVFNGNKFNQSKGFYQIPQEAADIIFKEFARQPAFLRLMLVLIGTEPGFGLSLKWMLERTGMTQKTYYETRDALVEMGWLTCENDQVIVNYDKIYGRVESTSQKNDVESTYQKELQAISSLSVESTSQNQQNEQNNVESTGQKDNKKQDSVESTHQKILVESTGQMGGIPKLEGSSLNTPEQCSVNTSKELLGGSFNTKNSVESTPIIYKEIDNIDIDKLEYITYGQISAIVGGVCWICEDIVQLPNGRYFRVKKEEAPIDWGSMF